jgi:hypothetical protein
VAVQTRFLQAGAFDAQSLVTVPNAKLVDLSADQFASVEDVVRHWLGL